MTDKTEEFDAVIVGGGPAGMSAAIWCGDLGLRAMLIERDAGVGGQLTRIYGRITNYPGRVAANGTELRELFAEQTANSPTVIRIGEAVDAIDTEAKTVVLSGGDTLSGRYLVLAMGVRRKRLKIPGESEFAGRGILRSGVLESQLAVGKTVVVVGGGDAALENALILSKTAKTVYLVHRRQRFSGRQQLADAVMSASNIAILMNSRVTEIRGSETVDSVLVESIDSNECARLPAQHVLVRIGVEPNSELVRDSLEVDERDYILINARCETSTAGVYAVGDVASPVAPTIAGAVGQGATAAKVIAAQVLD